MVELPVLVVPKRTAPEAVVPWEMRDALLDAAEARPEGFGWVDVLKALRGRRVSGSESTYKQLLVRYAGCKMGLGDDKVIVRLRHGLYRVVSTQEAEEHTAARLRDDILTAIRELPGHGLAPFTPHQVYAVMQSQGTTWTLPSVRVSIAQRMTIGSRPRADHTDDLERVARGWYQLRPSALGLRERRAAQ